MLRHPTTAPKFTDLFDLKAVGLLACVTLLGVVSCDLVNRSLDKRWLPKPAEVTPASWVPNSRAHVIVALRTQDAERHACASGTTVSSDLRCEYETQKRRFQRASTLPVDDNLRTTLQPYVTAQGNHPVLLSGVWHTPQVAYRRHLEPSRDRRKEQLQLFYADCDVEFVAKFETVDVRYEFGKPWAAVKDVPVGRVHSCVILQDPQEPSI